MYAFLFNFALDKEYDFIIREEMFFGMVISIG